MRYKLTISYDGSDFFGWQIQPESRTVQGEIEQALESLFKERIRIVGASRTDRGVHAIGQVAHFDVQTSIDVNKLAGAINGHLPDEIHIQSVEAVSGNFHARYQAKSKIYQYHIVFQYLPFKRNYTWYVRWYLDVAMIKEAVNLLCGEHDFTLLAGSLEGKSPICNIFRIDLTTRLNGIIIKIEGNRFLRQMVRRIVGLLVDVGREKSSVTEVADLIRNGKPCNHSIAPAQGLYLVQVIY